MTSQIASHTHTKRASLFARFCQEYNLYSSTNRTVLGTVHTAVLEKRHAADVLTGIGGKGLEQLEIEICQVDLSLPIVMYEK